MLWLFRFFSRWPLGLLHMLGAALGWLVWLASARYRAQFRANVAQAGLPFEVARPAIAEAGRFVGELPKLWMRPRSQSCLGNVQVQGQTHADQAFSQGRGVIFFGPHCGSFELGPQALAELYGPITAIYRPARKAWLARLESFARDRQNLTVVPASLSGIRLMHKALKANQAVAMLTDQVPPEGWGVWAPFFGKPAYTMTLVDRLQQSCDASIILAYAERLSGGRGYALHLSAMPGALAGERPARQLNRAIEGLVRRCPAQYYWGYNRYKVPAGAEPQQQPANA
jgi:KDO2-lipid IV(A) lauroyltransferase